MWNRGNISGRLAKVMSYIDSTFSDHGIFRIFWRSWGVLPGQMYRSNQPYPYQIKRDIKNYKIKSIINLRGERHCSSYYLEKNICALENIKIHNFPISSRDIAPEVWTTNESFGGNSATSLIELSETATNPLKPIKKTIGIIIKNETIKLFFSTLLFFAA